MPNSKLEGYSKVLGLKLRWEKGQLKCFDPTTTKPIMSLAEMQRIAEEERQGRLEAEQRAEEAEQHAAAERQARLDAEHIAAERIRELEAKLHRRGH